MHSAIGVGLRGPHYDKVLEQRPDVGFWEVHAENFFGGGRTLRYLDEVRKYYPISIHGVGLSLGSADGLDDEHLQRFKTLVDRVGPFLVSEHLSWSTSGGHYMNDLLPMPYTEEALMIVSQNIDRVQTLLKRQILIENPSIYLALPEHHMDECAFLTELVAQSGCGLLMDVNNVYVSGTNLGYAPERYLQHVPWHAVQEIHVAGHAVTDQQGDTVLVDDHGSVVRKEVWALYSYALKKVGAVPTLIEWDMNVPELDVLLGEAEKAHTLMQRHCSEKAAAYA